MSNFRFGLDDYGLNYYPIDATDGMGGVEWEEVERVEIEGVVFVRERLQSGTCHDTGDSRIFHCSKCGYGLMDVYIDDEYNFSLDPNFCPNCGAKVQGQVVE